MPETRHFAMRDGVRLAADWRGDSAAAPVVFLHGGGQTRHSWTQTAEAVSQAGWQAITVDLRGHGESDWSPTGDYSPSPLVGDLVDLVSQLPCPPVVVGASLGGLTAIAAAGEAEGELLAGLVLVDVAPRLEPAGVRRIVDFMTAFPDGFADLDAAADAISDYLPHRPRRSNTSGLVKILRQRPDGRWVWHWDPSLLARPVEAYHADAARYERAAASISCPTLLVRGAESDVVSEEIAHDFLALVPHADWVDVRDARHMLAGDANDPFTEAVLDFLAGLKGV
jgi:non-heme chloroperoxidase